MERGEFSRYHNKRWHHTSFPQRFLFFHVIVVVMVASSAWHVSLSSYESELKVKKGTGTFSAFILKDIKLNNKGKV